MPFEIRNEALGPIPPCSLDIRPLTILTGGDAAGMGLLLRSIFFLSHLKSLMQILWERDTEDDSSVLEQPVALQAHLAQEVFQHLIEPQEPMPGVVLRWKGSDILLGSRFQIRSLSPGLPCLFFPKERIITGLVRNPLARASMGLSLELLHGSKLLLQPGSSPQIRLVELPELSLDIEEQRAEILRLADWVNCGHTVIVTTNSRLVIQGINNLLQASLLPNKEIKGMPLMRHRLPFAKVRAYHLRYGEIPEEMFSNGVISDAPLARHEKELASQLERIQLWVNTIRTDSGPPRASGS